MCVFVVNFSGFDNQTSAFQIYFQGNRKSTSSEFNNASIYDFSKKIN